MPRHLFWVPLATVAVALVFALICLLVRLSRGHPWLIRRKLAVGALLLSLTWVGSGCSNDDIPAECYAPLVESDVFLFDPPFQGDGALLLDLAAGARLTGTVRHCDTTGFAYRLLVAADEQELARGAVAPADGAFDGETEGFVLDLEGRAAPGTFWLEIHRGTPDAIAAGDHLQRYGLLIVDGTP